MKEAAAGDGVRSRRSPLRYALAICALAAAAFSLVLAAASHLFQQDTPSSVAAAVRLAPNNSAYLTRLAAWDAARRSELLRRAVKVNPFDDAAWIRLGLDAELREHDAAAAEQDLLEAARVNRMFLPRITLANFYFRHGEKEKFLRWSKAALEMTPYPADPLFANMWLYEPDGRKLAAYVPDRPGILAQYVIFLSASRQYDALPPAIARLVNAGAENPVGWGLNDIVGPTEDRLLESGNGGLALQIWATLLEGHWLDYKPIDGSRPLTNGDFRTAIWGHGFDWSAPPANGVMTTQEPDAPEMRFAFDGNEDDHAVLLKQWLPLETGRRYRLEWLASSDAVRAPSGLSWRLQAGATDITSGELLPERATAEWEFAMPQGPSPALLSLQYARPTGEMRANGMLVLRAVKLTQR